jgi:hypothetical protein
MQTRREQYDIDRTEARPIYSSFPTSVNRYNLNCSSCHRSLYVSKEIYEQTVNSIQEGLDNPFMCDDCRDEFAELEHEGH